MMGECSIQKGFRENSRNSRSHHRHAIILIAATLILPFFVMEVHVGLYFLGYQHQHRSLALEKDERLSIPFQVMKRTSSRKKQHTDKKFWDPFGSPTDIINAKYNNITTGSIIILEPSQPLFQTSHRSDVANVVFAFGRGYNASEWIRFVGSLIATGFEGDIVLGIADDYLVETTHDDDKLLLRDFVRHTSPHHHVIVYHADLDCLPKQQQTSKGIFNSTTQLGMKCITNDLYRDASSNVPAHDPRIYRHVSQIRYEYYLAWAQNYSDNTNIMVSDVRDVYFQQNPFMNPLPATSLQVFVEDARLKLMDELNNKIWIKRSRGSRILSEVVGPHQIVCSGITLGGKLAMLTYFKAMIQSFDESQCTMPGCDQGHHNYLLRAGQLDLWNSSSSVTKDVNIQPSIQSIQYVSRGDGVVHTLGLYCKLSPSLNLTLPVYNVDGTTISSVLHQFDRCNGLSEEIERKTSELVELWKAKKRTSERELD
jgi:hypothetical protein